MTSKRPPPPIGPEPEAGPAPAKSVRAGTFRAQARVHALDALEALVELANNAESEAVRVAAANAVLNRALGRPTTDRADEARPRVKPGARLKVRWLDPEKS